MGKRGRHGRRGKGGAKRGRPRSNPPRRARRREHPESAEPALLGDVRRRLSDEPLELLALVSTMLAALDPRARNPFDRARDAGSPDTPTRDDLVASFLDVDRPETSALLAVVAAMSGDELEQTRIRRELARRAYPLPVWLGLLRAAEVYRAVEMIHVLRDGDNLILGARLPTGHELTAIVYIDHNLGTVVKDAYVVDEPIAKMLGFMRANAPDPDISWNDVDLADARARVTEAVEAGAITVPRFESETWPACRPIVEWLTGLLPEGGTGYVRPEWRDDALARLTEGFFASEFGADLDDADHRSLLESLLWFGTDYGPGDPLHWSPTAVEILLADWIPRKILADAPYLSQAPDLLRAFIRYCHRERALGASLTAETLAAVDEFEPDYQRIIRMPRPQGPAALLARMGALDPDGPWALPGDDDDAYDDDDEEPASYAAVMLDSVRRALGSEEALDQLDDQPLPDEPFAWGDIPSDVHERVAQVQGICDRVCDDALDVEYRTACRRLLTRVAAGDANVFRRRARADTAAAAICWIVGKANDLFKYSPLGRTMLVKDLLAHFGVQQGNVSQRAATMLRAGGFDTEDYGEVRLGSPAYLVSSRRRRIIEHRDRYRALEA